MRKKTGKNALILKMITIAAVLISLIIVRTIDNPSMILNSTVDLSDVSTAFIGENTRNLFQFSVGQRDVNTSLSEANASFIGENSGDLSGISVAGVGDVNNDGFDDILIGATQNSEWETYAGQTYLIFGRPTTDWQMDLSLFEANASFIGEHISDYSGVSVAGAGDVNNDSYDDILVGAPYDEDGGIFAGQTYLILGRPTADWQMDQNLSEANASFIGENSGDRSGYSVAGAGDVNNDGYDDILIGAYFNYDGGDYAGQTYLILGGPTATWQMDQSLSEANASFIGENSGDYSGYSVAGAGDVNNDGYDDILIGAYENYAGQTYLILGGPTATWQMDQSLSEANASFIGEDGGDYSGYSVAGAGDVNNDGYEDILIGAYLDEDGGIDAGQTYLILGRPTTDWQMDQSLSEANASFIGEDSGDESGYSVAGAGDVNNDSYDDILIGAYREDDGGINAGQTYLILGRSDTQWRMDIDLSEASTSFIGEDSGDYSGYSVAGAGDVNNDGYEDILIGAYNDEDGGAYAGQTYLILGEIRVDITSPNNKTYGQDNVNLFYTVSDEVRTSFTIYLDEIANKTTLPSGSVITDLSEGSHNITIIAVYAGGNVRKATVIFTVDTEPPIVVIESPTARTYTTGTITIYLDGDAVYYWYFIEGADMENQTWIPIVQRSLVDGTYTLHAYGNDSVGNEDHISVIFTIDIAPPTIDHPKDITYEEDSLGNTITWNPFDGNPSSFRITRDEGLIFICCCWYGEPISISVDGLPVGKHQYNCTVYDKVGNYISDTVTVIVVDTTPPTIDHPTDILYVEDVIIVDSITWHPSDNHPDSYTVTMNGTQMDSGMWDGGSITISFDELTSSNYTFICTVFDKSGNSVSDSVLVCVLKKPSQASWPTLLLSLAAVGLVVVLRKLVRQRKH